MEKLLKIQSELKAPKNQFNSFGKYNYRSCEDIIEAVKPLLFKYNVLMTISDKVINIGNHNYIESTVTCKDLESKEVITVTASARESENKKGMDDSQITGSTSSYARKYALNGMYAIDDTKDADTRDNTKSGSDTKNNAIDKIVDTLDAKIVSEKTHIEQINESSISAEEKASLIEMYNAKPTEAVKETFFNDFIIKKLRG